MDNHYRMYALIFIIFVSAVFNYSWAESIQIQQKVHLEPEPLMVITWSGEDAGLYCGVNPSVDRYWRKGEEVLTKVNVDWTSNSRIESLNQSTLLTIKNVRVDDEGQYTCVVNTTPIQNHPFNLHVKALTCELPEKPLNGYFKEDSRISDTHSYKINDTIQYFCNRGFELVGEAIRTCSGPPIKDGRIWSGGFIWRSEHVWSTYLRWTPQEPSCEPDYIVRLQKAVVFIGNKVTAIDSKCTSIENKITTLENKITSMENRMTSMENRLKCEKKCECGFTKLGDHCYYFGQDVKTQPEALSVCRSLGSTLAYPRNSVDNTLLKDYVRKNFKTLDWWLDGSDAAKEGTWVWAHDQSPITYTDWNPGEPNNGGSPGATESCLFLGGQWNAFFYWHDAPCSWKEAFICQRNVSVQFVCN